MCVSPSGRLINIKLLPLCLDELLWKGHGQCARISLELEEEWFQPVLLVHPGWTDMQDIQVSFWLNPSCVVTPSGGLARPAEAPLSL